MFSNKLFTFLRNNFLIFSILLILQSCGAFKLKRADVKDNLLMMLKKEREILKKEGEFRLVVVRADLDHSILQLQMRCGELQWKFWILFHLQQLIMVVE